MNFICRPIEDIVHEDNGSVDPSGNDEASTESSAPAPQVKLSADGTIILDEERSVFSK